MELIRISEGKLKIMLTPSDMRHFELDMDGFGEDGLQMHRSFRLLLDEVKRQSGFEADDRRISVQYFPSREGGCEMFISNLAKEADSGRAQVLPIVCEPQRALKLQGSFCRELAYRFECLRDLLSACHRLLPIDYITASSAWRDENEQYYLILTAVSPMPFSIPEEMQFLAEYGRCENAAQLRLYLLEYGLPVCAENAVGTLGVIA